MAGRRRWPREVGIEDAPRAAGGGLERRWWNRGREAPSPAESPDEGRAAEPVGAGTAEEPAPRPAAAPPGSAGSADAGAAFLPRPPIRLEELGVDVGIVEDILLRTLRARGSLAGRALCRELALHPKVVGALLGSLRHRKLVQPESSDALGDFVWGLTERGRALAEEAARRSSYVGPAPVSLADYVAAVEAQSVRRLHPGPADLERAFADLLIGPELRARIGPALAGGRGLFLHGPPGNGKTSIAERIAGAYGGRVWLPRTLVVDGLLVHLYDPVVHGPEQPAGDGRHDRRWVRVRRPTVVAGGELTLEMLDVKLDEATGVCEAPLQLRANTGCLVVDDFGRQRVRPDHLLNRWIVPLERGVDYLRMPNARKLRVPFDVVLVFSTNMDPASLVDEAFLRRIPYKVAVPDPTEEQFLELLDRQARALGLAVAEPGLWDWLVSQAFRRPGRPMRFCHPRDLLSIVLHTCRYEGRAPVVDREGLARAVEMYFGAG